MMLLLKCNDVAWVEMGPEEEGPPAWQLVRASRADGVTDMAHELALEELPE